TVVATSGPVLAEECPESLPPIGRPIDNTRVYILDEQSRQVPIGSPGELHIGGAGLARGYVNRPELAGGQVGPSPCSHEPGARMYRTGDLAGYRPDGQIDFLGRIDDQLKIRGFRVEPNEIVTAINSHPDVIESVIIARDTGAGDKHLLGYIVLAAAV